VEGPLIPARCSDRACQHPEAGMRLTAAGERVLEHVRSTMHDFHLTRTDLDALKGERKSHVALASMMV
jgi:DNA-binding transcriptional LysR family regulator